MSKVSRFEAGVACSLVLTLVALLLVPYLTNGLWFDDALNGQIWGMLERFHSGIWEFSIRVSKVWVYEAGRILLGWPAIYSFYFTVKEPTLIRIAHVAFVVVHIGLVVWLLRRLRCAWPMLGIFLIFLVSLFQIRNNDDPVAAYATFCQVIGIAFTLALLLLLRWWETGRTRYQVTSSVIIACSLAYYELNMVYVPICLGAIYCSAHTRRLRNAAIVLIPFAIFVAASLYVKKIASDPYPGSEFGSFGAAPLAYLKQLIATFPGSFYVFRARSSYPLSNLLRDLGGSPLAWLSAVLACSSYALLARQQSALPGGVSRRVLAGALAMVLIPPVLIAISSRYQKHLGWGDAHLPVYYQYFGLALLGAIASTWAFRKCRAGAMWTLVPLFALYVASNLTVNRHQAAFLDSVFVEPRNSLVTALENGLLDLVEDGDIVEISNAPIFINGNLIYQAIGKRVSTPNEAASIKYFESPPRPNARSYRLYRDADAPHSWLLSPVDGTAPR